MRKLLIFLLFLLPALATSGQKKYTISGTVKDEANGETLISSTVYDKESQQGIATNAYGYYSISVSQPEVTLLFSYLGYITQEKKLKLDGDLVLNIDLRPKTQELGVVTIEGDSYKEQIRSTQTSVTKVTSKEAKELPALFGEVDIIKTLQLKPGVQSGSEGSSGLYIRGGGADQNLIVLDEAIVYNANHLFGFFSTFNADAIKNVELYKGGFPARYGGRLSSVVDVQLNDGNRKEYTAKGGIGLISSRLTAEGPIKKDKSSFIVSGRRTYADLITRQINKSNEGKEDATLIPDYYFYDLNAKINYDLGPKDKVYLSGYFGRDVFKFEDGVFNFGFDWGNATGTLRWNHILGKNLFSNTSLIFSDYQYTIANKFDVFRFELGSNIRDLNLKSDFLYNPNETHHFGFGFQTIRHEYNLGRFKFEVNDDSGESAPVNIQKGTKLVGYEHGIYASDDIKLNNRNTLNLGLRVSAFSQKKDFSIGLEPRVSYNFSLTENSSFKASYARMRQYNNLVSNSGASLPTDIWYPSTNVVKPQTSDQLVLGYNLILWNGNFLLSNEVYYKNLQNQIDLKDNANIFVNDELEKEFVFGKGWSYGNEIFLEKRKGKTTGWLGYTLSWSQRKFGESNGNRAINEGEPFYPGYDRRHDISIVIMHKLSNKFTITGTWIYGSGAPTTLPTGFLTFFDVENENVRVIPDVDERGNYRYAPYHRADLGVVWNFYPKWGKSDLTLSIFNLYDRRNPYFIYYEDQADGDVPSLQFKAKQVSLFPILPSLTFNFQF